MVVSAKATLPPSPPVCAKGLSQDTPNSECDAVCDDTYYSCTDEFDVCEAAYGVCVAQCDLAHPEVSWTSIPDFGAPPARRMGSLFLKDNTEDNEKLILFGGSDTISYYGDVWYFNVIEQNNVKANTWYKAPVR
ncbi:hypothetical protein KIPB_004359, partial [Kipferlia bialata]|eukprot:g4359.t1